MIYNPYNTTVQTPGVAQPGMIGQPTPALGAYPTTPVQAGFPMMQQPVMPVDIYQQVTTQQTVTPATYQQVTTQQPMAPATYQQVATQQPTAPATYQQVATQQPMAPATYQPVVEQAPMCQVPTPVPAPVCPAHPYAVPVQQPVTSVPANVQPKQVAPVQQPVQNVEPQIASTQTTTAKHKKTTYVEAYLEPVDAKVPLVQPTVSKQVVDKKQYPMSDELVYVDQQPLKSSTQQDYNLYLMENEYYSNNQKGYQAVIASQPRADQVGMTCENLPLATTYIKSQTYNGYNTPAQTMQQGTGFNELYSPYTPKKVAAPTVFILEGGQR